MTIARALALLPFGGLLISACSGGGGDGGGGTDFGETTIPLSEDCEGVAGLNGDAVLAASSVTQMESQLGYTPASGPATEFTAVTVDLTWPDADEASCYPSFDLGQGIEVPPRVAIEGLTFAIVTSDGGFAETLDAKAWAYSNGGFVNPPVVLAVTDYGDLEGDWEPYPDYTPVGDTMLFVTTPVASNPEISYGTIDRGDLRASDVRAGVTGPRFQMASW